jgi:outer membrane receptor protein involved in Fe transport
MTSISFRGRLAATTILSSAALLTVLCTVPAYAQSDQEAETVVVTGSRIHREASDTTTSAPTQTINVQSLSDRGYTQIGDALNTLTSMTQSTPITPHNGTSSGSGQQFPNLFNLGADRTLSLINGRRVVGSGTGLGGSTVGGSAVDTNMIPVGLLDHVDVVLGGGSVVYGSDAVAGVVNYVLKDHFVGLEVDGQAGLSEQGDYPNDSARVTAGTDFLGGKGNIAIDVEWSKTDPLLATQRSYLPQAGYTAADSTPPGSKTSVYGLQNSAFWEFNRNGVLFVNPPGTLTPTGYQASFGGGFLVTGNGQYYGSPGAIPQQFLANGSGLTNFNVGTNPPSGTTPLNIPFSSGGDGFPYTELGSLLSGVERHDVNVIGHVDLPYGMKLSTELFYGRTAGIDPNAEVGNNSNTVLNNQPSGGGAIIIKANNPYLPASAQSTIVNYLNTTFGGGLGFGWLFGAPIPAFGVDLSKAWTNLLPSYADTVNTNTYRGLLSLEGSVNFDGRDYYWNVSASVGHATSTDHHYDENVGNFQNAVDATTNGSGQIVCAINNPVVTDAACVPINPFVENLPSGSVRAIQSYVAGLYGQTNTNTEQDYLATIGGPVATLPAGDVQSNLTYEHRVEDASFEPTIDTQLGLGPSGTVTAPTSGSYNTNEIALEALVPVFGKNVTLPGVQELEVNGAYRYVDNSVSGSENVWDVGARWTVVDGLTLRTDVSRNFRAPSLYQLFDPATTSLQAVGIDPCDSRSITLGPNGSANRMANCAAEFAAHPGYGALSSFTDVAQNFSTAAVTTQGNSSLRNEVSHVWTYGAVVQPEMIPGLTFTVDRIEITLNNALTQVTPSNILAACYDSSPAQFGANPMCQGGSWTRGADGSIVAAKSTFLNAAYFAYRGETYNIAYGFDVNALWGDQVDRGHLDLNLQSTYTETNNTSILGGDITELAGTAETANDTYGDPRWVTRFDAAWTYEGLRVTYELFFLPQTLDTRTSTYANTPFPKIAANYEHSISAQYAVTDNVTVRGGITNFTNEAPSYPTLEYGDVIGRRYFVGVNVHF